MILSTPNFTKKTTRLCDYFPTIRRLFFDYFSTITRLFNILVCGGIGWVVLPWFMWLSAPAFQRSPGFPSSSRRIPVISGYYSINYSINAFKIKIMVFFKVLRLTVYIYTTLIKTFKKCLKIALKIALLIKA